MNTRSHRTKGSASGRSLAHCRWLLIALPLLLLLFTPARAAAGFWVRITGSKTVDFPDANPDITPTIQASRDVRWVVHADRQSVPWVLTILADDDLRSGSASIPANAVTWIGLPALLIRDGRLSTVTPSILAQGSRRGNIRGAIRFSLDNSWDYDVGFYTTTVTLTASSP